MAPTLSDLAGHAQEALLLSIVVSLPVIGVAALAGLIVAVLQASTQVHDITLAHLPRLLVVALTLAVFGSWIGSEISAFTVRVLLGG